MTAEQRSEVIKIRAAQLGFDACGIASADTDEPDSHFREWIAAGYHADMNWLAQPDTMAMREDVRKKLPGAQSVVVVARNYYAPRPPTPPHSGTVSRYAWGKDYHKVLQKPMKALSQTLDGLEAKGRVYISVDTGPVLERTWAARAGIGWLGKNGLVLNKTLGSWFFLGVLLTTVELAPDEPLDNHCGSCRRCIDACPTQAIVQPHVVDSRQCLSYQTIENRGDIPEDIAAKMGATVFGCDICQDVCPWNQNTPTTTESAFLPRDGVANPSLDDLLKLSKDEFNRLFAGTPVRRAKYSGIMRNARIVYGDIDR